MDYPKSVPGVGLVDGKFIDENTTTGQVGSLIPCGWGNAVTDELLNVIRAGGEEPVEGEHDQLVAAIRAIVLDTIPEEQIRTTLAAYGITDAYTKAVTYTKTEIEDLLKNLSALPVGAMVPFPKGTVPTGFLEVDGSVKSSATYPDLSAYLGTTYNIGGEGAGNFRLPDSRGEFFRGWDHGRGVDAGRALGSYQADEFKKHRHPQYEYDTNDSTPIPDASRAFDLNAAYNVGREVTALIGYTGGSETRPRNVAVMWCIKAWNAPVNQGNIDIAALMAEVQALRNTITSGYKGLFVSATGTNALIAIKARNLIVGNGVSARSLERLDLSINLATVGLGGLDAGALVASSWYSTWVATNGEVTAGIAALMPIVPGTTTAGSPVITAIASTASMRPGMQYCGANFPSGAFIKSVDSPTQITASIPAIASGVDASLRFVYEPALPVGYIAKRVNAFPTDATANKFPLSFNQTGNLARYVVRAGSNVAALPSMAGGVLGNVGTPTWAAVSVSPFIPPTAAVVDFFAYAQSAGAYYMVADTNAFGNYVNLTNPPPIASAASTSTSAVDFWRSMSRLILTSGRDIYCASNASDFSMRCLGWEDTL